MHVIKFALTGAFLELYYKEADTARSAYDSLSFHGPKNAAPIINELLDDYGREAKIPAAQILGVQLFSLDDEFSAQTEIVQLRNNLQHAENLRMQQRASGILVPAGMATPNGRLNG